MLRTDKPIYKVILVLNLLFIVAGVASCISLFTSTTDIITIITNFMTIAVLVFAGFYILYGYKKDAAKYYKLFGLLLAIKSATMVLHSINAKASLITNIIHMLSLAIVLVLLLSRNLGKNKSFILCGLLIITRIVGLIRWIAMGPQAVLNLTHIADIDLACLYGILTYAKYLDKTERGAA